MICSESNALIVESFSRSAKWLISLSIDEDDRIPPAIDNRLLILLGAWICARGVPTAIGEKDLWRLADSLSRTIDDHARLDLFDPFQYDAKLLLLAKYIFHKNSTTSSAINEFASLVECALLTLHEIPTEHLGEALILTKLGHPLTVPLASHRSAVRIALEHGPDLLRYDVESVRRICNEIGACTCYGSVRSRESSARLLDTRRPLEIIMLQSLRRHNLEFGALVLRTLCHLKAHRTSHMIATARFLISQQSTGGVFGTLDPLVLHKAEMADQQLSDLIYRLNLSVTVACLWALGECLVPTFSIFDQ